LFQPRSTAVSDNTWRAGTAKILDRQFSRFVQTSKVLYDAGTEPSTFVVLSNQVRLMVVLCAAVQHRDHRVHDVHGAGPRCTAPHSRDLSGRGTTRAQGTPKQSHISPRYVYEDNTWRAGAFDGGRDGRGAARRGPRKAYIRLPGKGNSNSHGARPVHRIISTITWIRTSRLSMKNSLWRAGSVDGGRDGRGAARRGAALLPGRSNFHSARPVHLIITML